MRDRLMAYSNMMRTKMEVLSKGSMANMKAHFLPPIMMSLTFIVTEWAPTSNALIDAGSDESKGKPSEMVHARVEPCPFLFLI